jgi:hypothetical protein
VFRATEGTTVVPPQSSFVIPENEKAARRGGLGRATETKVGVIFHAGSWQIVRDEVLDGASFGRGIAAVGTVEVAGGLEAIELRLGNPDGPTHDALLPAGAQSLHPLPVLGLAALAN